MTVRSGDTFNTSLIARGSASCDETLGSGWSPRRWCKPFRELCSSNKAFGIRSRVSLTQCCTCPSCGSHHVGMPVDNFGHCESNALLPSFVKRPHSPRPAARHRAIDHLWSGAHGRLPPCARDKLLPAQRFTTSWSVEAHDHLRSGSRHVSLSRLNKVRPTRLLLTLLDVTVKQDLLFLEMCQDHAFETTFPSPGTSVFRLFLCVLTW